jgi:phage repressor protein C with HTH and peptisase S24 domain
MKEAYNIQEIRKLYGLNQGDFARKVNMSRELVSKIENGKVELKNPTWKKIQRFLQDHPLQTSSHDVNIIGRSSQSFLSARREQKNEPSQFMVPLVGIKAQAGYMKGFEQTDFVDQLEKYSLPPGVNPVGAVWRYFEIDGDSMEPTLSAGDVVLATMVAVEDWNDLKNFCVYVIHTADQLLIKRLYKKSDTEYVMISDNEEAYPQQLLHREDVKQLWLFRRHIRARVPQPKEFKITA